MEDTLLWSDEIIWMKNLPEERKFFEVFFEKLKENLGKILLKNLR